MNGKLAIFAASFIAVGSISGIALGRYATTPHSSGAIKEADVSDTADSFDSAQKSPIGTTAEMLAPDHIPVCRKGCGPTLDERKNASYYGDEYSRQLDAIYRDDQEYAASDTMIAQPTDIMPQSAHQDTAVPPSMDPPEAVPTLDSPHHAADMSSVHDAASEELAL